MKQFFNVEFHLLLDCNDSKLNPNYSQLIARFCESYMSLHHNFGVALTRKFHIISSHMNFYINTSNKSLGHYSDQLIESMHQYLSKIMTQSSYHVKDINSEIQGAKLLKTVCHTNSYVLG